MIIYTGNIFYCQFNKHQDLIDISLDEYSKSVLIKYV